MPLNVDRCFVVSSTRFRRTPDGAVWAESPAFGSEFWCRYQRVFHSVTIVGRVNDVTHLERTWTRVDGRGVDILSLPNFEGMRQYVMVRRRIQQIISAAVSSHDAVILRLPCVLGFDIFRTLRRRKATVALEVVGDPFDGFAPGNISHPLRPILRWRLTAAQRFLCRTAKFVSYVTESSLQRRYPSNLDACSTHYSSVSLPTEWYVESANTIEAYSTPSLKLISVGSLSHPWKATDVLIDAVSILKSQGCDASLTVVGDGSHRSNLEKLAQKRGVFDRVTFLGKVSCRRRLRGSLLSHDVFVLPSRTEGLPRAMIEAMALGLPCIGTRVGGIPELIDNACMVEPGDPEMLAELILRFSRSPGLMAAQSTANLSRSRAFSTFELTKRRDEYYGAILNATRVKSLQS
ncbi:glycosyltransferase [Planctomycetota bacterium]